MSRSFCGRGPTGAPIENGRGRPGDRNSTPCEGRDSRAVILQPESIPSAFRPDAENLGSGVNDGYAVRSLSLHEPASVIDHQPISVLKLLICEPIPIADIHGRKLAHWKNPRKGIESGIVRCGQLSPGGCCSGSEIGLDQERRFEPRAFLVSSLFMRTPKTGPAVCRLTRKAAIKTPREKNCGTSPNTPQVQIPRTCSPNL
jgi:hypothetical protein